MYISENQLAIIKTKVFNQTQKTLASIVIYDLSLISL